MNLSPQQSAVLDWVRTGSGSCNVIARAGCGKTQILMEVAKVITGTGFMGAFNKSIADEFKSRLAVQGSRHVTGATLHSAGNAACRRANPQAGRDYVDARKVYGIARELPNIGWDKALLKAVCDAVSFGKQAVLGVGSDYKDPAHWQSIIDEYDIQEDIPKACKPEVFIDFCVQVYGKSLMECGKTIDFDDMLLAPLYYQWALPKYDWVMIDEAQDTSTARRLIAFAMMHEHSRAVMVGDPKQAIYKFAGASSNAMDIIKNALGCVELPLTVTYRCPKSVVDLAQVWVPDFTAHPNAPEGEVSLIGHRQLWEEDLQPTDVLLCRNTRPLIGIAGRLRDKGIPCVVEGVSAKGLLNLAQKWGEDISVDAFLEYLGQYESDEVTKWLKKEAPGKVEWVRDRCDTLRDICRGLGQFATTRTLISRISMMFGTDTSQRVLTLCTIHRSKGRQWPRVYLIGRNRYCPSPYAESEEDIRQEENAQYVAVTRTMERLVEVEVPRKEKGETPWWEL